MDDSELLCQLLARFGGILPVGKAKRQEPSLILLKDASHGASRELGVTGIGRIKRGLFASRLMVVQKANKEY